MSIIILLLKAFLYDYLCKILILATGNISEIASISELIYSTKVIKLRFLRLIIQKDLDEFMIIIN